MKKKFIENIIIAIIKNVSSILFIKIEVNKINKRFIIDAEIDNQKVDSFFLFHDLVI